MTKEIATGYSKRADQFKKEQAQYTKQLTYTSMLRLVLFLVFAWFLYTTFTKRFQGYEVMYALSALFVFLAVVFWAGGLQKKIKFLQQLILINDNEINVGKGLSSFFDNGSLFTPAKGFTVDLNIFGNHSLYHLLNRAGSLSGKAQLAKRLQKPFLQSADINGYQACVKELAGKIQFRQTLLAHTVLLQEEEALSGLQSKIPENDFAILTNRFWSILSFIWPAAGILLIIYCAVKDNYQLLLAFGILGLVLLSGIFKKTSALYNHISKRSYLFSQYAICFQLICNEKFEHPYLLQKQKEIKDASGAFQRLSKLGGMFDMRMSLFSFIINGLFLFDLLCARAYLQWNAKWQQKIENWFITMGEIELFNSLATFHFNHPDFIFPECVDDQLLIRSNAMGHPLMKEGAAVVNDVSIGEDAALHLITGSNMSGKSTFLRTLGLNMTLAQIGAPVFAKKFVFRPVRLLTSFHHIDSLEESTSYFYAELKCLQEIITSLAEPEPALVLLDEVMRGTNSKDKHDGTALLIKKLLQFPCLGMIATHDTELGILANDHPGSVDNFCFESELSDQGLTFDFTMRKGVAQTKNATYLMQQMGII